MQTLFSDDNTMKDVFSFDELVRTDFKNHKNALCWRRNLAGDFKEIVEKLQLKENITEISVKELTTLHLSENANIARETIIQDYKLLSNYGASPSLNLIRSYERDTEYDFISRDVYSYHVDRSPIATDTFLCTYYGASSDLIPNSQAIQKILIPEIRQQLQKLHNNNPEKFDAFLKENFFDLHYQPTINAQVINLGTGNLWKLAVDHPQQSVLPCIHRAPVENEDYRLILIC